MLGAVSLFETGFAFGTHCAPNLVINMNCWGQTQNCNLMKKNNEKQVENELRKFPNFKCDGFEI